MNNDVVERIRQFMEYNSLNSLALSRILGYNSSEKLSRLFRGEGAKPSYDILYDISNKFDINVDWLVTGRGGMLKSETSPEVVTNSGNLPDNYRLVPLYNLDAVGGLHGSNLATLDNQYVEELVPFEDARVGDVSLWVTGESMIPTCPPGSKILIRKVVDWREYFGFGNMFVLLLNDGRRILKEVVKSEENPKTHVLCKSHNPKYSPEELPKSKIEEVWKVIQVHITKGW